MTSPTADWDKIGRYLAGEATAADAADVERWFAAHPQEAAALRAIDAAARELPASGRADVEHALERVKARMTSAGQRSPDRLVRFTKRVEFLAAAAAVFLVAGVFLFRRVETRLQPAPEVAYSTGVGQRDSVTLDDGSLVLLGPSSRVVVNGRAVTLTGDAYFRVRHDGTTPFIVWAGNAVVRDIGTAFTVQSDSSHPVRVVVTDGSVALSHQSDSVTLDKGDIGIVAANGAVAARRGSATDDDVAWMQGRLVFRDATMAEVAGDLRRWYGVELRVTDSLLQRRVFTGSFTGDAPAQVLRAIGLALGAQVERRGDTAFVRPRAIK